MISLKPGTYAVRKLLRRPMTDIKTQAVDRWVESPGSTVFVRPAKVLPGQLERIKGTEFGKMEDVVRHFTGGFDAIQSETIGYRLRHVTLIDGMLYNGSAVRHLKQCASRFPARLSPPRLAQAAMYESWPGNRWFGNWLLDDCLTYQLAEAAGAPVTSEPPKGGHKPQYEQRLGMQPRRVSAAKFDELILFDDHSSNQGKRERADRFRSRVIGKELPRHPGVFLLRGEGGDHRMLVNEHAIAYHLAAKRGFTVLDPLHTDLEHIARVCGSADVVAGVEGSQLVHGLMLMPSGGRLLVVQPPARVVSVLKVTTDRQDQDFSMVVGSGSNEAFCADIDEIERTLDLN